MIIHDPRDVRYSLFQYLKPLAPDRAIEAGETGDVAARMSEARDEPIANWIANPNKYDRYRARHGLEQCNCGIAERHDHVWRERNKSRNNGPHLVHRASPPARFYADIATVGPSQPLQTLEERREIRFPEVCCRGPHEDGDPARFTRLLRVRRERPSYRRTAEDAPPSSMKNSRRFN
jgi:hypothetical protein